MWQESYKKYSGFSGKELKIGIKDYEQRSRIILDWFNQQNINRNAKILDCGCGIGIAGLILKENGFKNIIGIDRNRESIKIASRFFKSYVMDCEALLLRKKFDVVLALNLIEHLENPKKFLRNIRKLLFCEGLFILSLPNEIWFRKLLGLTPKDPTHKQNWSIFSFRKFLESNGFQILGTKPIGRIPFLLVCQTFMVLAKVK